VIDVKKVKNNTTEILLQLQDLNEK